jgi:hypothetical protein
MERVFASKPKGQRPLPFRLTELLTHGSFERQLWVNKRGVRLKQRFSFPAAWYRPALTTACPRDYPGGDAVFRRTFRRVAQLQHLKKIWRTFFIILYIPFDGVQALGDTVT